MISRRNLCDFLFVLEYKKVGWFILVVFSFVQVVV